MADYINNVAAGDQYTDACTLGPDFQTRTAVITIANNPALMRFAVGEPGNWHWTDEREFFSIPQSFRVGGVIGLKARNANPGQVARVLATLSGPDDLDFEAGIPFIGQLQPNGSIVSQGISLLSGVANAQLVLTQADQLVPGTTVNVTVVGANASYLAVLGPEFIITVTGVGLCLCTLYVDGAAVGQSAIMQDLGATNRLSVAQNAVGQLAAGDHTFELRASKVAAGGTALVNAGSRLGLIVKDA